MKDPDIAFRRKMSEYGLYPGLIEWDGRIHHFPGKGEAEKNPRNKSGWYVGFRDRCGGQFGDFSQGMPAKGIPWQMKRDKPPTEAEREHWKHQDAKPTKRQVAARTRAAEEVGAAWEAAVPANRTNVHPYLEAKHIDRDYARVRVLKKGTLGLKIMGRDYTVPQDILLIPMRKNNKLVNVQRILGTSKRYWPGAEVVGAFCAVGGALFKKNKPLYLCEGWATAWSISECMKTVCIVAFNTGGLLPVAKRIREKYGKVRLIIAADNDRWSSLHDDTPNPGVYYATKVAEEVDAEVAIPNFRDLTTKPADFNDLHRMEGPNTVRKWLNPKQANQALTVPQPGRESDPKLDKYVEEWKTKPPFRCLGVLNGIYHYLPDALGQIVKLSAEQHGNKAHLFQLAPMAWWEEEVRDDWGRVRWDRAGEALMWRSHKIGVFQPGRIRGRGFWRDEDGQIVAHFGDELLGPNAEGFVRPQKYHAQNRIYTRLPPIAGPSDKEAMTVEESQAIVDMFASQAWDDELSGYLLAGWVAMAPFSGALDRPPHVWLTGSTGCGKTTIIRCMVMPLLGDMRLYAEGGTTEAGLRRELQGDAFPVVLDHAEYKTARAELRRILELARSASLSGGRILRGGSGSRKSFRATSMFLLASDAAKLHDESYEWHFTVLGLRSPHFLSPCERRKEDWEAIQRELTRRFTVEAGHRLLARTLKWFRSGKFDKLHAVVRSAADEAFYDERVVDQLGTLATGTWSMLTDEIPEQEEVVEWFRTLLIKSYRAGYEPEGFKVLREILQGPEVVRTDDSELHVRTAGQLVMLVASGPVTPTTIPHRDIVQTLKRCGMKLSRREDGQQILRISIRSTWVRRRLGKTPYRESWKELLRTIPGAGAGLSCRFGGHVPRSRTVDVPLAALTDQGHDRAA